MTWICCEHGQQDDSECAECVAAERETAAWRMA